ncbi:MAG TPA: DUF2252 domain-containing protein [Acidimicrobiales bacterium]|nr:DUF2252 domain-containing protein [Acidimicrobiales bacterium]
MPQDPKAQQRAGRELRRHVPRSSHGTWEPARDRPDPILVLEAQDKRRLPSLVPVRWGRMAASPFAFLRGSAAVMARDLAPTPLTGLVVQACGDAHVANFGLFASPERNLLFDVNDFDETFPGPWEWDLKRLATSAVVAARTAGLSEAEGIAATRAGVHSYRRRMADYAQMPTLEVWYSRVDAQGAMKALGGSARAGAPVRSAILRAERRTSVAGLPRLTVDAGHGQLRIADHPPLVTHELTADHKRLLDSIIHTYRESLEDSRRVLLEKFDVVDFALKVVGVGSVGTRCFVALLVSERGDPLFLQVKEAERSALDGWVPARQAHTDTGGRRARSEVGGAPSVQRRVEPQGRRVVTGQRLMQADSDIFLGWASAEGFDYYVRQLWDMKGSVDLSSVKGPAFADYLELCGWTLARAHARTGDVPAIAGYMGSGTAFDDAIVRFACAYADQTERDHARLTEAVRQGRVQAETGV